MKRLKLAAAATFALVVFACASSFAQTQDQNSDKQQPDPTTQATQEGDNTAVTPATDGSGTETTTPSTVTIDNTDSGTTSSSTTTGGGNGGQRESTTKIHIYSGKHDGNNVINPDPKNK